MNQSEGITVNTGGMISLLRVLINLRMSVMIWGGPGIGKSEGIAQLATELGMPMIDTRVSQLDAVDLRGLPTVDENGCTRWATPVFFPTTNVPTVWLWDEINSGQPSTMCALYQLINDRRLGEYQMPDEVRQIAAGNRESDGGVTYRMPSPLANRFVHLNVKPDSADWCNNYAIPRGLDPRLIAAVRSGYLHTAGEKQESAIYHFDRSSSAFLTPRSLAKCDPIIQATSDRSEERKTLLCGLIGMGHGSELCAYLDMCGELPDKAEIRKDPKGTPLPKNPSVAYAIACSIARDLDTQTIAADFTYLRRIQSKDGSMLPEYRMLVCQDLRARYTAQGQDFDKSPIVAHPEYRKEMISLAPYLGIGPTR